MKKQFAGLVVWMSAMGAAWAGGMESLEAFVKGVKSGRAEFTQTVTSPSKDGAPPRSKTSTGIPKCDPRLSLLICRYTKALHKCVRLERIFQKRRC